MHLKNQFILLLEATREDIKKYYPQINDEDYNKILDADKTGSKQRVGNLSRLVLDLYKKDKFDINSETLHDVYVAFDVIQKKKDNLAGSEFEKYRNLNMIADTKTLLSIKYYLDQKASSKIKLKAGEGENIETFYEDDNWKVLIPLDYQASVKLGREYKANWCTASSAAMTHFNRYVALNDLYIFIEKSTNEAWQYFNNDGDIEFNDKQNESVNYSKFISKNNLSKLASSIKTENKKMQEDANYHNQRLLKRYTSSKSSYIILSIISSRSKADDNLIKSFFDIYKPDLNEKLLISNDGTTKQYTTLNLRLYLTESKYCTSVYNKDFVKALCENYGIKNYKINKDLSVDAEESTVYFTETYFKKIPIKFNKIRNIFMNGGNLATLENAPEIVVNNFDFHGNYVKSLENGPKMVGGSYKCHDNYIKSLKGCPKEIGGDFVCSYNEITSLEFAPEKVGGDYIIDSNYISSLKGCPEIINKGFAFTKNNITSLEYFPKLVKGNVWCGENPGRFTEAKIRAVCNVGGEVFT